MTNDDQMKYDDNFKLQVLSDYYRSGKSKHFLFSALLCLKN